MKKMKKIFFVTLGVSTLVCIFALAGCSSNNGEKGASNSRKDKPIENTVTQESQTIGLTGVANARQFGGYVTTDGKKIKAGVLLRTAKLSEVTNEDIGILTDQFHLTEIIDLRTSAEIKAAPDTVIAGATNTHIPIIDESLPAYSEMVDGYTGNKDPISHAIALVENGTISDTMYSELVTDSYGQHAYYEFFQKVLAHKDGAFLFHCTGGKDRTGVTAVLLLSALGVDRDTILEDFALTNDFDAKKIDYVVGEAEKRTDNAKIIEGVKAEVGASTSYLENMFVAIDEKYGSMGTFLKEAIGLTDKDIKELKAKYLE